MDLINEFHYFLSHKPNTDLEKAVPPGSKMRKLFDLIITHQVNNDDQAAKLIYNTTRADKRYLMLKRNLVQKLSELVFHTTRTEEFGSNYETIRFLVNKELLIAEKLLTENVYHNPVKIISKVEQIAEMYYLIDIQLEAALKFRSVYALKGFPDETMIYDEKVKKLLHFQEIHVRSQGYRELLYSKTKFFLGQNVEVYSQAIEFSNKIADWLTEYDSPFLRLNYFRILLIAYQQNNQQHEIGDVLNLFEELINRFEYLRSKQILLEYHYQVALHLRNTGQLNQALSHVKTCLELSDYGAFNRFLVQALHLDIYVKLEETDSAIAILSEVTSIPQFQFLDAYDKSAWAIREAYLFFLSYASGNSSAIKKLPNFNEDFDLNQFLERTKKSGKDKYGYNIMMLLIRLPLLAIKDAKRVEYEGSNLMIYYHRYLKEFGSKRTHLFFRTVSKLASQGFSDAQLAEKEAAFLSELASFKDISYDPVELIPYERFWVLMKKVFLSNL